MTESVQLLIDAGANIADQDNDGYTALSVALMWNASQVLELLVNAKANVEPQDNSGRTVLMLAAASGNTACIRLLLHAKSSQQTNTLAEFCYNFCVDVAADSPQQSCDLGVLRALKPDNLPGKPPK